MKGTCWRKCCSPASILLVVLDDARLRTRRLAVLNELTVTIARGQNHAPMMQTALEKLKAVVGAKAAWFQLMEGDRLVPTQHVGLSPEFLRALAQAGMEQAGKDETQARVLQENRAAVMKLSEMPEPEREQLREARHSSRGAAAGAGQEVGDRDAVARLLREPAPHSGRTGVSGNGGADSWVLRSRICGCWSRCCARSGSG